MDLFDDFTLPRPIHNEPANESENTTKSPEKKAPKLRKSCELCRHSKGRCIPSKESGCCQRCAKEGKQCIFREAKPRPKRAKNSRIRVAEMEEKLDNIVALLATTQPSTKPITPPSDEPSPMDSLLYETEKQTDQLFDRSQSRDFEPIERPLPTSQLGVSQGATYQYPVLPLPDYAVLLDPISKNIISFEQAEESVEVFRSKAALFPWVTLPENTSLDTLRRERPFLLLSVLAHGAHKDLKLQYLLEGELKDSLMKKIIALGEQSLDLLQGLLVYISSYHLYFSPGRQQMYQLCQMAVSMTVDLRINKNPPELGPPAIKSTTRPLNLHPNQCPEDLERRRTLLGCYYICGSVCRSLRKPSNITYTDYANDCCQTLAGLKNNKTDHIIPYFVRLQQFSDDVNRAFDYDGSSGLAELDSIRIEVLTKVFNDQLKQFESSFPAEVWTDPSLRLTFLSQRIFVNEIGFHATRPHPGMRGVPSPGQRSWYNSASRNECLIRSVHAAKDYVDYFLSLTSDQIKEFMVSDLIRMVYAILVIGAINTHLDAPTLDVDLVRRIADMNVYIPAVMTKLADVASKLGKANQNPYLYQVAGLFGYYRTRFQEAAHRLNLEKASEQYTIPQFGFDDMLPMINKKCIEWDEILSLQTQHHPPPFVDDWEEVLSCWPSSFDPSVMSIDSSLSL